MRKRFLCFALSAMLILTFIPQISFAAEEATDIAEGEDITTEEQITEPAEEVLPEEETAEPEITGVITGFVPLETTEYYYEGNPDESDLTIHLPETLSVYLDGSDQTTEIPVYWHAVENFEDTDFYFYSMKPVWSEGIVLSDTLSEVFDVPWITVYKQEPDNTSIEPVVTEEEAEPIYTEEEGCIDPETDVTDETAEFSLKALASDTAGGMIDSMTEDDLSIAHVRKKKR